MDLGCAVPGVGKSSEWAGLGLFLNLGSVSRAAHTRVIEGRGSLPSLPFLAPESHAQISHPKSSLGGGSHIRCQLQACQEEVQNNECHSFIISLEKLTR